MTKNTAVKKAFVPVGRMTHYKTELRDLAGHVVVRFYHQHPGNKTWEYTRTREGKNVIKSWSDATTRPIKKEVVSDKDI